MGVDVLDGDGRIINQNADGERQAAQGHDVHGLTQRRQTDDRGQSSQWNGDGDDQRAAPAAQKQQDHHRGQCRRDQPFSNHALHRGAHKNRLIADGLHGQFRWQRRPQ